MDLFSYLMGKKSQNTFDDLFSYLLGKNKGGGGGGTYTTYTGTSLNISNTIKAKIKNFMLNSTELTQDGTPSPSSPVDVNVITGNNNVMVENKNLFDYHWFGSDKEVVWTYYHQSGFKAIPIYIGVGNTATFSSNVPKTSPSLLYGLNNITDVGTSSDDPVNANQSRTIQANANGYVYLAFVNTRQYYTDVANGTYYIQIEIGSTATEYVEHQEQNYPIGLSSKNVFNIDDFVTKMSTPFNATNQNGVVTITRKSATTYDYLLNCKENTQYTVSMDFLNTASGNYYIRFKYSDNSYSDIVTLEGYADFTKITATSSANKTLTSINFQLYGYNNNIQMKNIQLEEGTLATTYEPYYNLEYCKIGDYRDQIFKNTTDSPYYDNTLIENEWYLKKNIGKVVLDGSEDWTQTSDTSVSNFYIRVANEIVAYGASGTGKSNYFKYTYANSAGNFYFSSATRLILSMENTYTLETFKTWLSTHNTNVYYPLATPTYIHISESDYPTLKGQLDNLYNKVKSYNGQTNITQTNDDLPFNIEAKVLIKNE